MRCEPAGVIIGIVLVAYGIGVLVGYVLTSPNFRRREPADRPTGGSRDGK